MKVRIFGNDDVHDDQTFPRFLKNAVADLCRSSYVNASSVNRNVDTDTNLCIKGSKIWGFIAARFVGSWTRGRPVCASVVHSSYSACHVQLPDYRERGIEILLVSSK